MSDKGNCESSSKFSNFNYIPDEILLEIFRKLNFEDLCKCSQVCRRWYDIAHSLTLTKKIFVRKFLKPRQFAKLVQHHFHKQLEEFQFLSTPPCLVTIKKMTFFNLRAMCPELKKLVLTSCSLKYVSLEDMPASLQYLSLRKSELNPYNFFKACPQRYAPYLTCLDVGGVITFLTSQDLHIFTHLKSLRCLYLEGCFRINDGGIESMIDLIHHLEVLDVEGTDISNGGAEIIISNGGMLKELYIGYTNIDDTIFDNMYMDMFLRLQSLCIRCTNISLDTVKKFRKHNDKEFKFFSNNDPFPYDSFKDVISFTHYHGCNHYLSHSCPL